MTQQEPSVNFEFGDRVRHPRRPEWGIGSVVKVENTAVEGTTTQRVSIRFPNGGLKTLSTNHAALERVTEPAPVPVGAERPGVAAFDKMSESGWLAPMAKRKIEEVMIGLPETVRDPFLGLEQRLRASLDLYRFDRSGRGLVDWAVAQSGLDDPLARFNRHELEELFDRWATERDNHLARLLAEARTESDLVRRVAKEAVPAAQQAVRRITPRR